VPPLLFPRAEQDARAEKGVSDCAGCGKEAAKLTEPVRWVTARVWYVGVALGDRPVLYDDIRTEWAWSGLPDAILGAIGVRSDGTTDWLSGVDWYGWIPFGDDWRLSGIQGSRNEMLRVAARYPGSVWKEGILVSDADMERVSEAMREYQGSVSR
jgi:hypothetical protein